jgi:hypothetical protein
MVLQVSTKTDILIVILINLLFNFLYIFYISFYLFLQKEKFDYDLVNFNLIENINTVNSDLK